MVFCKDCTKLEGCNKECVCCSDGIPKDKEDNKSTKENHSKEDKN